MYVSFSQQTADQISIKFSMETVETLGRVKGYFIWFEFYVSETTHKQLVLNKYI